MRCLLPLALSSLPESGTLERVYPVRGDRKVGRFTASATSTLGQCEILVGDRTLLFNPHHQARLLYSATRT